MKYFAFIRWAIGTTLLAGALSFGILGLVGASQQDWSADHEDGDEREHDEDTDEQHRIRHKVRKDNLLPLERILELHKDRITGRILDLEVEREHGKIIYEMEYIDGDGVIREVYIDAATGDWLKEEVED